MKDKILFWLNNGFVDFAIAKSLQKICHCDLFAIADVNDGLKHFFQNQNLTHFNKIWYYRDYVLNIHKKPDLKYLSNLEEKYSINLWSIAYADRLFYSVFNKYHKFSDEEILSIMEQSSKFFEHVLEEIKPDFLIMYTITAHHTYLLYDICRAKGVKILMLEPQHFGNRWAISKEMGEMLDVKNHINNESNKTRSFEELQNFLDNVKPIIYGEKSKTRYKISKSYKLRAAMKFVFSKTNSSIKNQYALQGRTKFSVLLKGNARMNLLKSMRREFFINKNFIRNVDPNELFVYYPLAQEPEKRLLIDAPYYTNQPAVITNIAKSLPVNYKLYVKEHPVMKESGWRDISYYKQIMDLPNVVMIHPSVSGQEILKKCSLVITISGTAALEALFFKKPSIVFVPDTGYSLLSSICKLKNIEELPNAIRYCLKRNVDLNELNQYVNLINDNSFHFDQVDFTSELTKLFNYNIGYLKQEEINEDRLRSFLNEYDSTFEKIAQEYINKIKEYEK